MFLCHPTLGVPYWYDRRTKETYWERPLMPAEQVPVKQGGTGKLVWYHVSVESLSH